MLKFFIPVLFVMSEVFAWSCDDCQKSLAQCQEWADQAARDLRAPKYCDPNLCDNICSEEDKKRRGVPTNAEKYADERMGAEMGMINSISSFYTSLNKNERKAYNYVVSVLNNNLGNMRSQCYNEKRNLLGHGLNDNFMLTMCLIMKIDDLTYTNNPEAFVSLMNQLGIPKQYWNAAEGGIRKVSGDLAMQLY